MERHTGLALGLTAFVLLGFAGFETFQAFEQREQLHTLRSRAALLDSDLATLRHQRAATVRNLTQAQHQLAALSAPAPVDPSVPAERRTEMARWLARVKQLQRAFDEHPEHRIPEMRLLTDEDWLRVAKPAVLESDDDTRHALSEIRSAAITRYLGQLTPALKQFAAQTDPASTPTVFALGPHLSPGVDGTLLERYELKRTTSSRGATEWIVQNKAPIDADHDGLHQVKASSDGSHGTMNSYAPTAWIPDSRERLLRAAHAYRQATNRPPHSGMIEVLPYFEPPLTPATIEKIKKSETRARQR